MMIKTSQQKLSVHMVKNSKPVGRFFKKKTKHPDNVDSSATGKTNKIKIKQNESKKSGSKQNDTKTVKETEPVRDVKILFNEQKNKKKHQLMKTVSGDAVTLGKPPNGQSKLGKWQKEKPSHSVPLKNQTKEQKEKSNLPTSKRKIEDTDSISLNPKLLKKKKVSNTVSDVNENQKSSLEAANSGTKAVEDSTAQPSKKKRRKKKKKKNKVANIQDSADNGYKPVVIYKGKQDISANWKNLKEMIIEKDKQEAAKLMEKDDKRKHFKRKEVNEKGEKQEVNEKVEKQEEVKKVDKKLKKTHRKLSVDELMKEQERQTLRYEKERQKKSGTYKKSIKKTKMDEIWFDNVDPILLGEEYNEDEEEEENKEMNNEGSLEDQDGEARDTKAVAIDCEMVGVGLEGKESILARVSIVDQYCKVLYDKYVKPQEEVVDYRTQFSGIRPEDLVNGEDFSKVQAEVAKILEGKILVGHALANDLRVLFINHPRSRVRDSSRYKPFKRMCHGHIPKLRTLTKMILGADIQTGEHDSVQDAQAAMRLYTAYRQEWDKTKKKVYDKPAKSKKKTKVVPDK